MSLLLVVLVAWVAANLAALLILSLGSWWYSSR